MALTFDRTNGQVASSASNIVATSANKRLVFTMTFHNTDSVDRTLEVTLWESASPYVLFAETMAAGSRITVTDKHTLNATTDLVKAVSDAASVIDYWISFVEIT